MVYPSDGHGSKLGILRMKKVTIETDMKMTNICWCQDPQF